MNTITLNKRCKYCNKRETILVKQEDYLKWKHGELTYNAFPYLTENQNEMMISGICGECFPDEED